MKPRQHNPDRPNAAGQSRLLVLSVGLWAVILVIAIRLFAISVASHDFYAALAENQHGIFEELYPERGAIYLSDPKSPEGRFPVAVNKTLWQVYADPRAVKDPKAAAARLAPVLDLDEPAVLAKLQRSDSAYVPLKRKMSDEVVAAIQEFKIAGIGFAKERSRFYPDSPEAVHAIGFLGSDASGDLVGRYGVEGYWNERLAGQRGFLSSEKDPFGRWIGSAGRDLRPAVDGDELTLTIDRTIQHVACTKLRDAVARYQAEKGSLVIIRPKTGAVLAICGVPDFDANAYSAVKDMALFNNPVIFDAWEPGSIFKPITMVAAMDAGKVTPASTYEDTGSVTISPFTIKNADGKANGVQTMTQVLEKSLNTGVIFAVRRLGPDLFRRYVKDFGFGEPTGIDLDTESGGGIGSLSKRGEIWNATASFGQGVTVTPIQMAAAFGVLANGGKLMKPYVVAAARHADGTVTETEPTAVRQVVTKRAAALVSGMLVQVVEDGHGKKAGVPGYWVAGKTGTAQIPKKDGQGYEKDQSIGSFAGFAPASDPAFVMVVRLDRPKDVEWAESSAAPLFGDIAAFLLQYMEIQPERTIK